jgi:hypothetical protein
MQESSVPLGIGRPPFNTTQSNKAKFNMHRAREVNKSLTEYMEGYDCNIYYYFYFYLYQ